MRKNKKSKLYKLFVPTEIYLLDNVVGVIDSGYLLNKIVWNPNDTFIRISEKYINHLKVYYTNYTVVFDSYPDSIILEKNTIITKLILRYKLRTYSYLQTCTVVDFHIKQAEENAEGVLIVNTVRQFKK